MVGKQAGNISPQRYSQKRALNEVCRLHGLYQDWLAMRLGKAQGTISKWLDETRPDFPGFEDWNALIRLIKDHTGSIEPVRAFCQWYGADAVALSAQGLGLDPKTLGRLTSLVARKGGSVVSLMVEILEDGEIDPDEQEQLGDALPEIEALYVAIGDLRERARAARRGQKRRRA